jgi:phosphoribosyl 1,2-cyclic phosphodiesterase
MPVFMLYDTARELGAEWYQYRQINYLNSYHAGSFNIIPIPAKHDVSCAAYLVISDATRETLLFATDYMYLEHNVTRATHAIIEVNYQQKYIDEAVNDGALDIAARRRVMKSHAELQTAIKVLQGLDNALLKEIHIAHLSDRHANAAEVKEEIQRAIGKPVYICHK